MANTGYITSSGIQQVFTSGPFLGAVVSSSYASGGIAFGPTINYDESFISGSSDVLSPCTTTFYRYYQDLITCPVNGCVPPTMINALALCDPYNYTYQVFYNSGSTDASYTIIEYSINPNFTTTGSYIQDNSAPYSTLIDVSDLPSLPTAYTTVNFRAYNSCSLGTTSSYSEIVEATICGIPGPAITTLTFNSISSTLEDPQWQIYTIAGEPGTRIDYSTSNLMSGNHNGVAYIINTLDNTRNNLYFTVPTSGYYIIPASGYITLQIFYNAKTSTTINEPNCVSLDLSFIDFIDNSDPILPAGLISLSVCDQL